jgi:hypothetical protein
MAEFHLTPCKIREGWIVPVKNTEPLTLSWPELATLCAPSGTLQAKQVLRKGAAPCAYVLLVRHPTGFVSNMLLRNPDLSGDIRALLRSDPTFEARVVGAYRFDKVFWDAGVVESATTR